MNINIGQTVENRKQNPSEITIWLERVGKHIVNLMANGAGVTDPCVLLQIDGNDNEFKVMSFNVVTCLR